MRVFDIKRLPFVHNQLVVCFDNCTGTSNTGRMNEPKWRLWFVRGKRPTNRESLDFLVRTKVPSLYNFQHMDWPMSRLPRNRSGNFDWCPPPGRWDRRWSGFCASYDPVSRKNMNKRVILGVENLLSLPVSKNKHSHLDWSRRWKSSQNSCWGMSRPCRCHIESLTGIFSG